MRIEKAKYHKAILPEHQGNPFIEALPPKISMKDVMESLGHYPDLSEDIRNHPDPMVREEYTVRLKNLRQPLPLYFECFRAIETALKTGYSAKNPFSSTTAQYLHYSVEERPDIEPQSGYFEPKGEGITLIGESGVGKTSMLEQILGYFPNVIVHDNYKNKVMEYRNQIVWLKVDCPSNSSVRDLCEEILWSLDLTIGCEKTKPEKLIGTLMKQIEQKIKVHFLGILIIDEMQRLVFKRTGGENNLLNFLHSLVNKLGVPIFFCANPPFNATLSKTLKAARRAESGGYFKMKALQRNSMAWDSFVHELWDLHWTNVTTKLSDELNDQLHELSIGNLDIAHRIYRDAQRLVIGSSDERITTAVLEQAYVNACGLSSNTPQIEKQREQNALPRRSTNKETIVAKTPKVKKTIIGDITRPQHPEFELKLREIQNIFDLTSNIQDPALLQEAHSEADPINYLRNKNIICEDPLMLFA